MGTVNVMEKESVSVTKVLVVKTVIWVGARMIAVGMEYAVMACYANVMLVGLVKIAVYRLVETDAPMGHVQIVVTVFVRKAIVEIAAICESVMSRVMCMAHAMHLALANVTKGGKIKLAVHLFVLLIAAAMVFVQRSIYVNVMKVTKPPFVNIKFVCQIKMVTYVTSVVCASLVTVCVNLVGMGRRVKVTNAHLWKTKMGLFVIVAGMGIAQ